MIINDLAELALRYGLDSCDPIGQVSEDSETTKIVNYFGRNDRFVEFDILRN